MSLKYIEPGTMAGGSRLEIHGAPFGATRAHTHTESGMVVGSNIPGGLFVSYSPVYVGMEYGDCTERSFILPDVHGTSLKHNDRMTTFEATIDQVLKDGKFKFVGVTAYAGETCKPVCANAECCPFGYPQNGPQHANYYPRLQNAKVITQGPVRVNNLSDIGPLDDLHVVVDQIDGEPCRYLGAVTNTADDGTQPLDIDYRIMEPAKAGAGLWIELGRK